MLALGLLIKQWVILSSVCGLACPMSRSDERDVTV
jgi:hypothetical protein